MKPIRIIELLADIKANIVAFFSISMFVCLGVGLFLGIHWGAIALRGAVQKSFEEGNFQSIEVQFPYGLTREDVARLKNVEGVSKVECGYSTYVSMQDGSTSYTLKMQSITKEINRPIAIVGNMPMEKDEVAILRFWAEGNDIDIGDTIKLSHDALNDDDQDGMAYLNADTFTVTALVDNPEYVYRMSDSLGVSNTVSGTIDCVGFVTEDAFDTSAFLDGYPNVYIRCDSLEGLNTFTDEYKDQTASIVDEITELGGELGTARYNKIHDDAKDQLDEAQQKIDDGERQLAEGQQKIDDGERQLAEGQDKLDSSEKDLTDGKLDLASKQVLGTQQLAEAYRQLAEGKAKYDAGVDEYNMASELYNEFNAKFQSVRAAYDVFIDVYNALRREQVEIDSATREFEEAVDEWKDAPEDQKDAAWARVEAAHESLLRAYLSVNSDYNELVSVVGTISSVLSLPISIGGLDTLSTLTPVTVDFEVSCAKEICYDLDDILNKIANASIAVNGVTIYLTDIPGGLDLVYDQLATAKAELDSAKAQLDAGMEEYNHSKALYDQAVAQGQAQISEGERELANGKATLSEKSAELEEGKETLKEKSDELDEGKADLEDAKGQFEQLVEYEWVVMPRQDNGGVQGVTTIGNMMDSVKWAMASLFIIVGLFVCYSAISRLVHEQIVQIGTKKALGFREGEIAFSYLAFSGLAVLLGVVLSVVLAVFVVQAIMNPTAYRQFSIPAYGPYVSVLDVLVLGGLEMFLILAATWFAIHGMLKREALDLLRGESTANVKEHFYERTRLWNRMSLFSQTVVNNCVNDKRRVAGTLIGVIGCTALIVVAVTLAGNVALSIKRHYSEVYSFDSIAYLEDEGSQDADSVAMGLYKRGISSTPAFTRKLQVRQSDGTRSIATLVVPTNEDSFKKFYNVVSTTGEAAEIENGGLWLSAAYGEHMGVKVGDKIILTECTGKTHAFTIAGFFDYYLLRQEFVLSQNEYRQAFGTKPESNVLLVNTDGADIDRVRDALKDVEGYSSLVDDYAQASYAYNELQEILRTVVLIYLALSGLMALMVLLNLDIMFVEEKKRELIVLMINGFSAKDAKAYIYRDSIALAVIGIVLGIVLGAVMGAITVYALEPDMGYFIKSFNWMAAAAGASGAGLFSVGVLLYSLRLIPRFDLTDINRF